MHDIETTSLKIRHRSPTGHFVSPSHMFQVICAVGGMKHVLNNSHTQESNFQPVIICEQTSEQTKKQEILSWN